jgi:hypothetical protein
MSSFAWPCLDGMTCQLTWTKDATRGIALSNFSTTWLVYALPTSFLLSKGPPRELANTQAPENDFCRQG